MQILSWILNYFILNLNRCKRRNEIEDDKDYHEMPVCSCGAFGKFKSTYWRFWIMSGDIVLVDHVDVDFW